MSTEPQVNPEVTIDDFSPAEIAAVDRMAAPIIEEHKRTLSFTGSRNRTAYKRMNRPEKTKAIDKGAEFIYRLLDRNIHSKEA